MKNIPESVLVIADMEGSSGCWSYAGSSFMTEEWCVACLEMTRDVDVVTQALLQAGVKKIFVQDFHRTGYNLLPELINGNVEVRSGYRPGPVPGMGYPDCAESVLFLGMHAASGTNGFLPHTLTSRISHVEVNGYPLPEVALFSAALAPFGMRPVFFSGCPTACAQAAETIRGIVCYPINKGVGPVGFDAESWRSGLGLAARDSLKTVGPGPYVPQGPFVAVVTMRDGENQARRIARRWGFPRKGASLVLRSSDMRELYTDMIRLCYLTPESEKVLPWITLFYRMMGRLGLAWVRRELRRKRLAYVP